MAAKLGLVLDCADPESLAGFWSAALGYTTLGGAGSYVLLVDEAEQRPKLLLQRVDEPKPPRSLAIYRPMRSAEYQRTVRAACRSSGPAPGPCR